MVSVANVRARFPILSDSTKVPDDRIQIYIDQANLSLSPEYYGPQLSNAIELYVACNLVNQDPTLRSQGAPESESLSGQGRRRSVAYSRSSSASGIYGSNPYCAALQDLRMRCYSGGVVY